MAVQLQQNIFYNIDPSRGCEFESWQWILDGFVFKIVLLEETENKFETDAGDGHLKLHLSILGVSSASASAAVWPDWAIYWTLGKFLKPLATINLPKSLSFLCNSLIFLVKSFLGNYYRHLAIFFWSHWSAARFVLSKWASALNDVILSSLFWD